MKLLNKVALITGAGSGIGRATALLFAKEGATVVVTDVDASSAQETRSQIEHAGGTALALALDVSQEAQVIGAIATAIETFGRLDILHKPAQSAFVATELEAVLCGRNITHLLFTGVTTECCVLGSYRHGSDLGFYGLLLEDCCATFDPIKHQAAIEVVLGENGAIRLGQIF